MAAPTTAAPAVVDSVAPTLTDRITLPPFVITLPTAWPVLHPTDTHWASHLAQVQAENPDFGRYVEALAAMPTLTDTVAVAWSPPADIDLALTAMVIPADGQSLQSFVTAVKTELEQSRLALGVDLTIANATIRYDLQGEHIPIAAIQYTMPAAKDGESVPATITGYQTAMLDQSGNRLLLLAFVTHQPQPTAALAEIETIVARLQDTTVDQ